MITVGFVMWLIEKSRKEKIREKNIAYFRFKKK